MDSLVYNIPTEWVEAYRGRQVIVRHDDPAEIVKSLSREDPGWVAYVQVLSLGADPGPMLEWGPGVPVDLVVRDVAKDLPLLYRYTSILPKRPVRVTVPVVAGFSKVVKLALALNFAVKLDVLQPGPDLVQEMALVLDAYLHQSTVSQPVEFFHSLLLSYYHEAPLTLWSIQEEDPSQVRTIAEDGSEALPGRLAGYGLNGDLMSFARNLRADVASRGGECIACDFLKECCGYFKWPDRNYPCEGVTVILGTIRSAAEQLREDLAPLQGKGEEPMA